jgi:hypothetical protein
MVPAKRWNANLFGFVIEPGGLAAKMDLLISKSHLAWNAPIGLRRIPPPKNGAAIRHWGFVMMSAAKPAHHG